MCGIVGFTGNRQAAPILLDGLSKLEYRGYDSAGLAVRDGENLAQVVKAKGRLSNLIEKTDGGKALKGTCGIGHTRWATHGEPSQTNAHPHVSGNCTRSGSGTVESEVVGVHNGIIENYTELKEKLLKHGYTFYSQTDTEVVIKLVDYYYKKYNLGPIDAIAKTMVRVRGSYALELMFRDYPGEIWVARKDSPMIIGVADGETYVASDVPAILKYTRNVYYIGNLEFARLVPGEAHFYDLNGDEIEKQTTEIKWDAEAAEKGGFEHFMMKEIHEQPKAVQDTLNSVIKNGAIDLSSVEITEDEIKNFEQMLHVRFIAINDDFDNIRQSDVDSLAVPIKNMVNSLYAKDISKKISLSYQMRREKGIPTSWCTPYGYQLNQQGNKFEATEDAKWVKLIYQWYLAGVSTNEIARRLEFLGVARPNERLNRKLHEGDDPTYNKWHPSTVLRILNSSAYIGELVSGKTQTASYKGIGLHPVEKKEWHIVENAHEAIILKSDFEKVQARREQNKEKRERAMARSKATREKCYNHLSGMVYCGCCRRNMTFERRVHGTVKETHYGVFMW